MIWHENAIRGTRFGENLLNTVLHCAVPENIHTPPIEGIGISGKWGILVLLKDWIKQWAFDILVYTPLICLVFLLSHEI